jgi:tetratricopeptide (TPR) repeat protein
MIRRLTLLVGLALIAAPLALRAQENVYVRLAQQAYNDVDFSGAIDNARRALQERLSREDRIVAVEIMAYSYASLGMRDQAIDAFNQLIFIDPDREPDVETVSPRITEVYRSALARVLVVRRTVVDSSSFVAGQGSVPIRYEVSRASRAVVRVVGQGLSLTIDSTLVGAGTHQVFWLATIGGSPVPAGDYQVVITAIEGSNEFAAPVDVAVRHSAVDTVAHLDSLPGYSEQPEYVRPGRDWKPLGIAVLYTGLVAGAAVALENSALDVGERKELAGISLLAIATGVVMSIKKPDPEPVQANILYNQLLREELARQNRVISDRNVELRRQTLLTVVPLGGVEP